MNSYIDRICLSTLLITVFIACTKTPKYSPLKEETAHLRDTTMAPFFHGVASGDPLYDQVILWTRITPDDSLPSVKVQWEISEDTTFASIVQNGSILTDSSKDYTVKVDVGGLTAGTYYYYRFKALGGRSMVGRTKTASRDTENVRFGVVSCSNYEWGFFNAYGAIAEEDLDAIVHLGDYIYEYAPGGYGDTTLGRTPLPNREIISLNDYRTRYSQYRLDRDLIAAHASHPFINVWDDHEISNDSYKDGAQNHQPEEGSYEERKRAARQVYYEWLPIRESTTLYRKFEYGSLVDLVMLDERLEGRTQQADSLQDPTLMDSSRTMLGLVQREWLLQQLKTSKAKWKVIGNQVIFSYLNWGHESFSINLDSWDGYPIEQQLIANSIKENAIENVVFITGDTHSAWAFEATNKPFDAYNATTSDGAFAVEFGTTSINSSNSNERFPDSLVRLHEKKVASSELNPHLKYTNMRDHGYLILELNPQNASAEYKFMDTIKEPGKYDFKEINRYSVNSGSTKLNKN